VNLIADLNNFQADNDKEYLEKFFIPGVRKAGDFRAAAVLVTQGKLLIHNSSDSFPADWVRDSAAIGGSPADVRSGKVSDSDLVSWLIPSPTKNLPRSATSDKHARRSIP
jgi:hypothetical protein